MLGYFYGNKVGLEGASVLRTDQPCRRRIRNGDEFNKTALALQATAAPAADLRQQPLRMVPGLPMSLPRLLPVRGPKLVPAILCPARAPSSSSLLLSQAAAAVKNKASMSLSKSLSARLENLIA